MGFTSLFAGVILIWFESVPTLGIIALAAILGTLGTEVVLKIVKQQLTKNIEQLKIGKDNE
ncbi:hypothetical protein OHW01_18070 [Acinetobacter baumannii]|nr:hypothetical protein [Acinetobacter baumannii]MCF1334400.1 hypothetical protein [Acinetobacter baumannii]MDC4304557.1 hypothetical protein [Acinetobacter baumannii]MDC4765114.1 hypothetical protein [Acinetobacter baumannii]MDC4861558.1 hypothetical protein [Acinetobacter baumannii]MDC4945112.1 hypothetical protein [Acinetobacter baumannii]